MRGNGGETPARASDRRHFAAREECHGCAGTPYTTRGFAYNTRMNRLFDKSIVLACCIAAAMGLAVDARLVAAFCLGVIATSLAELAQKERTHRTSEAASCAYIIAAVFVPPFVPFAPLALYDIARRVHRERAWIALSIGSVFTFALVADLRADELTARTLLLTAILSVAATLLSLRTAQLEREQRRMHRTRDELQERALALEARNRDLADRRIFPAIDPVASGTRNEDLLVDEQMRPFVFGLRRILAGMNNTERAAASFIKGLKGTNTNQEFLVRSAKKHSDYEQTF